MRTRRGSRCCTTRCERRARGRARSLFVAGRRQVVSLALAGAACGPSVAADASGSVGGDGSSTSATATTASADTTGAPQTTGDAASLCLSTIEIDLDTTDAYLEFADVDGDARPELWRRMVVGRGRGASAILLDAFVVEADGGATAVGTDEVDGIFVEYADVDGDGRDDLITMTEAQGPRSWNRGQADLTFATPGPISLNDSFFERWLDADGDGDADVFASQDTFPVSVTLYIGDGNGEFATAGTLDLPLGAWVSTVVATPESGVFIAGAYNGADAFGAAASFWRIELGRDAAPTLRAGTLRSHTSPCSRRAISMATRSRTC
ncbi:MAG: VCBS repeat-containing protein [Myxococcales bacterium]|nr:VCBS repeat-containing protein [Myxococcales bacterium]